MRRLRPAHGCLWGAGFRRNRKPLSLFEFLMMIASVVVAVGMTEIVGGWGRMMRTRATVKPDWLHLGWTLAILIFLIGHWIGMWSYRDLEIETVGRVVSLVIPSVFCVLAAYAITPDVPTSGSLDIREYYMAKRAPVFLSLAAFMAATNLPDLVIAGVDQTDVGFGALVGPSMLMVMAFTKHRWIHVVVLALVAILSAFFMFAGMEQVQSRFLG